MKNVIVFALLGFGFLLFGLGISWGRMFPGTASWTPEKAEKLSDVSSRMHVLTFTIGNTEARPSMHGGPDLMKAKAELEALKKENGELTAELRGVGNRRDRIAAILKWSGISLAIFGIIGWYAVSQTSS